MPDYEDSIRQFEKWQNESRICYRSRRIPYPQLVVEGLGDVIIIVYPHGVTEGTAYTPDFAEMQTIIAAHNQLAAARVWWEPAFEQYDIDILKGWGVWES